MAIGYQQSWTTGPLRHNYVKVVGKNGHLYQYDLAPGYTAADAQRSADLGSNPANTGKDLGLAPAGATRTNSDGSTAAWNGQTWTQTTAPTTPGTTEPAPAPAPNLPPGAKRPNSDGSAWVWNGKTWDLQGATDLNGKAVQPMLPASNDIGGLGAATGAAIARGDYTNAQLLATLAGGLNNVNNAANPTTGTGTSGPGGPSGTTLADQIANAQALQRQFNQPAIRYTAPTASASLIGPVTQAQQQAAIQAGVATAGQSTAAQIQSTALAQQQAAIQAERVKAALAAKQGDIYAQQVDAAQADRTVLGPTTLADRTQLAPTALADQTTIDALKQAEFRQGQEGLVSGLNDAIAGKDPSVAAIMLRQATERNQANQFAMAQAASGGNVGFAQRQAMLNAADINQQSIGQQALLRAQEIATARGQLGSVLSQGRGSDIDLATSQAQLAQQVKLANAGFTNTANMTQAQLDQAIKLANAGFKNTANTTQAQLDQATAALNVQQKNQVNLANANNALDAAKTNVQLAQQVVLANQSAENQAALANAQNALAAATKNAELAQQVALSNQSALNNTSQVNATLANATGIANAGNQTQASVTNANNTTSANTASATLANQVALANALAANKAAETNANNATNVSQSNAQVASNTNAQNITSTQNAAANTLTASGQAATSAANKAQADQAAANAKALADYQRQQLLIQGSTALASGLGGSGGLINALKGGSVTPGIPGSGSTATPDGSNFGAPGVTTNANGTPEGSGTQPTGQDTENGSGGDGSGDLSDRRKKKNVRRADAEIGALLGSIKPYGFKYKDPKAPGTAPGQRFGVMAQDLEKSRAGKALVNNVPGGKKVDTNQAVLTALAALGNMDKRLKKIEKRAA